MRRESREKEESDSSAGRKCETICCWLPAVLYTSFFYPLLLLQSIKVLSQLESAEPEHTWDFTHI